MTRHSDFSDLRAEVLSELDKIVDPCSAGLGTPIGLVGMGVIDEVAVTGGSVSIRLLPTFPNCMFRGMFEEEIETRLAALPWCREVSVAFCPADRTWDESRMTAEALGALRRKRKPSARPEPSLLLPSLEG